VDGHLAITIGRILLCTTERRRQGEIALVGNVGLIGGLILIFGTNIP
jgi:hypothetical protein